MAKTGRNEPCPCGSGKKYKNCHESKTPQARRSMMLMLVVGAALAAAIVAGVASLTTDRRATGVRIWDPAHGHYHDANGVQVP